MISMSPVEVRERVTAGDRLASGGPLDVTVEDRVAMYNDRQVRVRVYSTDDTNGVTLVYAHGGGWVTGDLEYSDELCRFIAAEAGCTVVSVDYRLSPEHPYPAALEDMETATRWAAAQPWSSAVAVGGDSAGGNLAAACTLLLHGQDGPRPVFQLLIYPVLDHDFARPSYVEQADGFPIGRADMVWFFDRYAPLQLRNDPLVSPLRAPSSAGAPSTLIAIAANDPLRDEAVAYADALTSVSVPVRHMTLPTMCHGFLRFTGASAGARSARDEIVAGVARLVSESVASSMPGSDPAAANHEYDAPAGLIRDVAE
ncbi:MAG: putative lipase/esterase [Marmoricola sp.]|nr:putative lipase/esterase [Marmoricola sp.]